MSVPLLEVTGVTAVHGKIEAVRDASIVVEDGSACCVCGPNGAGKTSFLAAIAGLLRPRRGTIRFAGVQITKRPPHHRVALGISLVPQERRLFQTLSVHENLWLGAASRAENRQIAAEIEHLYDRFHSLKTHQHRPAGALSGGEQQVLAIARGTLSRPKLLLLDEPTIGLAPRAIEAVGAMLVDLVKCGTAILLVEQNLRFALPLVTRVYGMREGRLSRGCDPARFQQEFASPETPSVESAVHDYVSG